MARNRIIYASQSVWCNGEVLYRVQSLGSTTTFTSEDIFELGHLDIVDVVDDVPAVAVTLNTNDFGDLRTAATLAQLPAVKRAMNATTNSTNANLRVVDSAGMATGTYLHGVCLADFAVVCGNLPGVTLWAPVQDECSLGTLDPNIDQTLFLDEVYVNSIELGYTTGANATENFGAETDNKKWFLNDGRFITMDAFDGATLASGISAGYITLSLPISATIPTLSDGTIGFLRKSEDGAPAVTWYDVSANAVKNVEIVVGVAAATDTYVYHKTATEHRVYLPTGADAPAAADRIEVIYSADAYGTSATGKYFEILDTTSRPDMIGAIRQGQVEVYIVSDSDTSYRGAWRLTGCTTTADLTRTPLAELGHLAPYDRPLTVPVPITVTVDSTMGDLENWAMFADQLPAYDANTLDDISLTDLMSSDDLKLVVMVYAQTDEEAGGTGSNRKIAANSPLIGQNYWVDGVMGTYAAAGESEHPLKTIIVEHLKITDEGNTLDMGANMTQTFGFRSTNDLYMIKGGVSITNITSGNKVRRNG